MAFDEDKSTPTYRIVLGVPGRSRALETAKRLGMPARVLELARSYLTTGHIEFERVLSTMQQDLASAARARSEAESLRTEAERLKREWTERTESAVGEMLERTRARLRKILESAQDEVRAAVRKLDEAKSRRDLDESRAGLNEAFGAAAARIDAALAEEAPSVAEGLAAKARATQAEAAPAARFSVGDQVRIPKWKNTGQILELRDGKAKVAMGNLQMTLTLDEIEALPTGERRKAAQSSAKRFTASVAAPPAQIDLRGMRLDDAMAELERYLDQAFRSEAHAQVTVVHGLGTGAIREGARRLFKDLPYIRSFHDAANPGATQVEFDRD